MAYKAKFIFSGQDDTQAGTAKTKANIKGIQQSLGSLAATSKVAATSMQADFKRVSKTFGNVSTSLRRVGRQMSFAVTLPVLAVGGAALKAGADFEAGMKRVEAITQATGPEIAKLGAQARELGRSTVFTAKQVAEAQALLGQAGFSTTQILGAIPGVLSLAASGQLSLADAASYASDALKGFQLDASKAGQVADVLAKGNIIANQSVGDLGAALAKASGTASVLGYNVQKTAAALAVLAEKGDRAEEGGTHLRSLLQELARPASKAREALAAAGQTVTDLNGKLLPLPVILHKLNVAGVGGANAFEYFTKRVGNTYAILDASQARLREFETALNAAGGTAKRMADKQLEGLTGSLVRLKSAAEGLGIAIARSGLQEWATGLVQSLTQTVAQLAQTSPAILRMGVVLALLAAAIGPAITVLGLLAGAVATVASAVVSLGGLGLVLSTLGSAIAAVAAPVLVVVGVIVALVEAVRTGSKQFRSLIRANLLSTANDIKATVAPAFQIIGTILRKVLFPALSIVGRAILLYVTTNFRVLAHLLRNTVGVVLERVAHFLGEVIPKGVKALGDAWDKARVFIANGAAAILEKLAEMLDKLTGLPLGVGAAFGKAADDLAAFAEKVRKTGAAQLDVLIVKTEAFGGATKRAKAEAEDMGDTVVQVGDLVEPTFERMTAAATEFAEALPDSIKLDLPPAPIKKFADSVRRDWKATTRDIGRSLTDSLSYAFASIGQANRSFLGTFVSAWAQAIQQILAQFLARLVIKGLGALFGFDASGLLGLRYAPTGAATQARGAIGPGASQALAPAGPAPASTLVLQVQSFVFPTTRQLMDAARTMGAANRQRQRALLGLGVA